MSADTAAGSRTLARNTAMNAAGQIVPLLLAVPLLPYVLHGLGNERFAVLTLAWSVIGYFGFLDLGLGRAATRFIAGLLGQDRRDEVGRVVWSSLSAQTVLGAIGAVAIALLAPVLAGDLLNIADPLLRRETEAALFLVAAGLPIVLLSGTLSGVLEAHQRFDAVNLVRVPTSAATLAVPALGVALGWPLPWIVGGIVAARVIALVSFAVLAARATGGLRPVAPHAQTLRALLAFGGWLTVSMLAAPILAWSERLLVGGIRSLAELAWYAVPFEIVSRTAVVPSAVAVTLFPAFSHAQSSGRPPAGLLIRSSRILFLLEWPLLVVLWLFPGEILHVWVGAEAALAGAGVMRLLALSFFFHAFAHLALAGVQGLGRPDLKAKLDVVQVPLYLGAAALLIREWGITGAAIAKLTFTILDASVLFLIAYRLSITAPQSIRSSWNPAAVAVTAMIVAALGAAAIAPLGVRVLCAAGGVLVIGGAFWARVLDASDRATVLLLFRRMLRVSEVST